MQKNSLSSAGGSTHKKRHVDETECFGNLVGEVNTMSDARKRPLALTAKRGWVTSYSRIAVFLMAATVIRAQSPVDVQYLTPRDYQRLNNQARDLYDKGVKALDHVDPVTAIQMFEQAAAADPAALELNFLSARLAYMRGRMVYGAEAPKYYDIAEKVLQRVGQQQNLTPLAKRRY